MASISAPPALNPEPRPIHLIAAARGGPFPAFLRSHGCASRHLNSTLCRCSPRDGSGRGGWESMIQDVLRSAVNRLDDYVNSRWRTGGKDAGNLNALKEDEKGEEVEWDWGRWNRHFGEVEEQEKLLDALKCGLHRSYQKS